MSFVRRQIDVTIRLGEQTFGSGGENTLKLSGNRVSANITRAGGVSLGSLNMRIWGMTLDQMNKASVTNLLAWPNQRNNIVIVEAGDADGPLSKVFSGNITLAAINAGGAPDVSFDIVATSAAIDTLKPVEPTGYTGPVSIDVVLSGMAAQMTPPRGYSNGGVTAQLPTSYWPGSLIDQIRAVCATADCMFHVGDDTLSIFPKGGSLGSSSVTLSKDTGLVAYPEFSDSGMNFTALFNPMLEYGKTVTIKSSLINATGDWVIASVSHNLEAEMPDGQWFTRCDCGLVGHPIPIVRSA